MSRVTLAAIGFLVFAIGVSAWLLTRSGGHTADDLALGAMDARVGLTFASWSVKSDGALLADIDPGAEEKSTVPRKFLVVFVKRQPDGSIQATDGPTFSWAAADRTASASALFALGFRVSVDGRAFTPPDEPLFSDPIERVDGGTEQSVTLHAKTGGATATFLRHHSNPHDLPFWNRRAIGFVSGDGHLVYVTPDAIVVPSGTP